MCRRRRHRAMMRLAGLAAAVTVGMTSVVAAQAPDASKNSALPGGSSSLQETFEGWTLQCAASERGRACSVQQQQRHRESRQLVLAVELHAGANDAVSGNLVLPFGLRLASGAVLQIDDGPAAAAIPFSTCLPVGCLIPLAFDKATVARMRTGTMLKIGATAHEDGKQIALSVPLKGLSPALDRLAVLAQSGQPPREKKQCGEGIRRGMSGAPEMWSLIRNGRRLVFFCTGCLMVALGVIGAFLPIMPTTEFLIAAAWCFGKSSPRLEAWMLNHPRFGPALRQWRERGAMPRKAKVMAVSGMTMGYVMFWFHVRPGLPVACVVAAVMLCSAVYVATRPKPEPVAGR